ncbi:isochorismatase family protein, partial [Actinomadura adrarensis]
MAQGSPLRDAARDHLLTAENAALILIDYQPEQISTVTSIGHQELMLNVATLARTATSFGLPVILTTVAVQMGANRPTDERLKSLLPGVPEIDRTSMNSWEDEEFHAAVEATGRKKLIMGALWTEVCLAFPALDALREGYEVYAVSDAV